MKRAIRRHHRARLFEARKKYHWLGEGGPHPHKRIAQFVDTPQPCSCYGCCNQRRNDWQPAPVRSTMQERRFLAEPVDA